jgi:16S rRNA (guanine527-N7)-methyltransferase
MDALSCPRLPDLNSLWQQTLGWQPDTAQQLQFQRLYQGILEGNQQLNLTRITQPEEFWEKHLWDSLRGIARFLQQPEVLDFSPPAAPADGTMGTEGEEEASLSPSPPPTYSAIDIGTGAGFPGIPIAIVRTNWTLTLLDATRKKMEFLRSLLERLGIDNAQTLVGRVEAIGQQRQHREQYDLALVRAVAEASICAEYALPLLRVGGVAVLYRGQWTEAETESLQSAVHLLGGRIEQVEAFSTPLSGGDRHCLYLRKITPTPKNFPRAIGVATQKPLGK